MVVKAFWDKKLIFHRSTIWAMGGCELGWCPWPSPAMGCWNVPALMQTWENQFWSLAIRLPSDWIHKDLFAAFSVLMLMGFFTSISQTRVLCNTGWSDRGMWSLALPGFPAVENGAVCFKAAWLGFGQGAGAVMIYTAEQSSRIAASSPVCRGGDFVGVEFY